MCCRSNLKQLDDITVGLRRRLLAGHEAEEQAQDSESAVPLSTSSAFVTAGSTVPNGTWELQSTLHSSSRSAAQMLASTGDSATAGDAVTELMRRTLKCTDSHSTRIKDLSHALPYERNHASGDDDVDFRNLQIDCTTDHTSNLLFHYNKAEEQNSETRAFSNVDRYTDSLKTAQVLLQQLNEITASSSQRIPVASNHQVDSPIAADFDEDGMQEDDTFANIWALRQSTRYDDGDDKSLDSTTLPNEQDKSYVSPQALNDVGSEPDDFCAPSHPADDLGGRGDDGDLSELESEGKQQPAVGCSGESGETWFIDTQDVRDVDNMAIMEIRQKLQDVDNERLDADETGARVVQDPPIEVHSHSLPLSQSSPSRLVQLSPAGSTASYMAQKSRSLRRTAVQRREQMYLEQNVGNSSDSELDDFVASMRLRHRRPQNSHLVPSSQPAAGNGDSQASVNGGSSQVVDNEVKDMVGCYQESETVANQDIEDNNDEPQSASSDIVTARSANQDSQSANTVSDDQGLSGHHSPSGEDMYPEQQLMID